MQDRHPVDLKWISGSLSLFHFGAPATYVIWFSRQPLDLRRYGSKHRQNTDHGQTQNGSSDVGDRVTRVAAPTGDKRLKSFDGDAISEHCEHCDRWKFAIDRETQAEHRR